MGALTQALVNECFFVDFELGTLTWKVRPPGHFPTQRACNSWNTRYAGKPAGCPYGNGYMKIVLFDKPYKFHRIIFLAAAGYLPEFVDHINGNRSDNRLENLRPATRSQNNANQKLRRNKSGVRGVYVHENGRYQVQVKQSGRHVHYGMFATISEAKATADAVRRSIHGEFFRNHTES